MKAPAGRAAERAPLSRRWKSPATGDDVNDYLTERGFVVPFVTSEHTRGGARAYAFLSWPHRDVSEIVKRVPNEFPELYTDREWALTVWNRSLLDEWARDECAICGRRSSQLYEDHDHGTGLTRGYLCPTCNTLEGYGAFPAWSLGLNPAGVLDVEMQYQRRGPDPYRDKYAAVHHAASAALREAFHPFASAMSDAGP